MAKKEQNFFSAVVYLDGLADVSKLASLDAAVMDKFANAEIICCYDGSAEEASKQLDELLSGLTCPAITVLYMGKHQGLEAAMNSGVDAAVGDYVLEVDELGTFDDSFITRAYEKCMQGDDIVIGEVGKRTKNGRFFYPLFNRFSGALYDLSSSSCSLVSRRAINRVRSISDYAPYRKAAYASSGLSTVGISAGQGAKSPQSSNLDLAMDALAIYSDAFYKISFGIALAMIVISLAELIYVVTIYCMGIPIGGWTTTMLAVTFGFLGAFVILTFILKYVALLVRLQMGKNNYLIEGIEKIGNTGGANGAGRDA